MFQRHRLGSIYTVPTHVYSTKVPEKTLTQEKIEKILSFPLSFTLTGENIILHQVVLLSIAIQFPISWS